MSGLVLLLPHGYEGQGPEHSSARLERFLQLCGRGQHAGLQSDDAGQVLPRAAPPDAPQLPQAAGRHDAEVAAAPQGGACRRSPRWGRARRSTASSARSTTIAADDEVRRVVLCSGKVYFDLLRRERRKRKIDDVALVRIEQLYPFPSTRWASVLSRYRNAEVVWCQEEPQNMGAWDFVDRRIEQVLAGLDVRAKRPRYVGRAEAASPGDRLCKRASRRSRPTLVDRALTIGVRQRQHGDRDQGPGPGRIGHRGDRRELAEAAGRRGRRDEPLCRARNRQGDARGARAGGRHARRAHRAPRAATCRSAPCSATSATARRPARPPQPAAAPPRRPRAPSRAVAPSVAGARAAGRRPATAVDARPRRARRSASSIEEKRHRRRPRSQPTGQDGRLTKADVLAAQSSIAAPAGGAGRGARRCRPARDRAPTARSGCG